MRLCGFAVYCNAVVEPGRDEFVLEGVEGEGGVGPHFLAHEPFVETDIVQLVAPNVPNPEIFPTVEPFMNIN